MFETIYASMILQNNDTIAANETRRNQEQLESRLTEKEKCILRGLYPSMRNVPIIKMAKNP